MNYSKKILLLIAIATLIRLVIASCIELGNDEVYYRTYALHLQWNYFDHPPIVGWLIRLTTVNLWVQSELFVRLGAVASSAVCTFLIYRIGTFINSSLTGWYAALLYNASIYGCIIAGTFILPDSPQMAFWLWAVLLLLKISRTNAGQKALILWCSFGVAAGLCIMSKVHGIFLWGAAGLYVLFIEQKWFKYKGLYLAVGITLLIISPIIVWNIQNNFVTYTFHGERVSLTKSDLHFDGFLRELAGEIFYNNPINFFLIIISLRALFTGKLTSIGSNERSILLLVSLPLIVVLLFISLFKDTLPHWSGPAYSCLIIFAAINLTSNPVYNGTALPGVIKGALSLITIVVVAGICIINFYPGTLSPHKQTATTGEGDFTLDLYGWKEAGEKFNSLYITDTTLHLMPAATPIIVNKWFPAAHIDYYIASCTMQQTYAIGSLFDLHHYYWLNQYKSPLKKGTAAYYIVPSNLFRQEQLDTVAKNFDSLSGPAVLPITRGRVDCKKLYVYRLKGFKD